MATTKNKSADGLRGIASLNVALAHFAAAFMPAMLHSSYPTVFNENTNPTLLFKILTSPFFTLFYNGHFAVLVFFVLSGYVLSLPYYKNRDNSSLALKKRLWGRYVRLNLPIIAAITLSYTIYRCGLYFNAQAAGLSGSVPWLDRYFTPGIALSDAIRQALYQSILFGKETIVPPLWTLKVEFVGSLYLLLFYLAKPKTYDFAALGLVFCLIYALHEQDSIYFYALFLGALLNTIQTSARSRLGLFLIGLYFGAFQFESAFYNFLPQISLHGHELWDKKAIYNTIGALCVTAAVIQGFGANLFQSRLFQFLGKTSFSLYLVHFIVLCSFASFLYIHFPRDIASLGLLLGGYLTVCFAVAMVFERFVDRTSIGLSHKISTRLFK